MTGTIPSRFGRVPPYQASHVCTDRRNFPYLTVCVAISGDFFPARLNNRSLARFKVAHRIASGARESVFDQVVGIIFVLSEVIPSGSLDLYSVDCKQITPWTLSSGRPIPCHDCRNGSKGNAVAAKSGGNKLTLGVLSDVRQAIRRGNDLPGPPMLDLRCRHDFFQSC